MKNWLRNTVESFWKKLIQLSDFGKICLDAGMTCGSTSKLFRNPWTKQMTILPQPGLQSLILGFLENSSIAQDMQGGCYEC